MNLKNTVQYVAAFAFALSISASAQAGEKKYEIWTGGLVNANYSFTAPTGLSATIGGVESQASIGYILSDNMEAVFTPGFSWSGQGGASTIVFSPRLGLNYSLGGAFDDAMFVQLDVGANFASASTTSFAWDVQFGKRYKVVDGVTFAPAVRFDMNMGNATSTSISVIPVQFSFMM